VAAACLTATDKAIAVALIRAYALISVTQIQQLVH
jgi:hypothetical protein